MVTSYDICCVQSLTTVPSKQNNFVVLAVGHPGTVVGSWHPKGSVYSIVEWLAASYPNSECSDHAAIPDLQATQS